MTGGAWAERPSELYDPSPLLQQKRSRTLCAQEEGMMLFLLNDYSDQVPAPGFAPLPPRSAKRRRTRLLPGSCGLLQPLPSHAGTARGGISCWLPCSTSC